jgi:putative glutamine amidotransferase
VDFMQPLIGIPCYAAKRANSLRPLYGNNQTYVRAVERAGGIPLLIPPLVDEEGLGAVCAHLDGLLLSGGADIAPARYGEEPTPQCEAPEPERDALELALARWALDHGLPTLGICRGMQLLNVASGGTLYQDIATQQPEAQRHPHTDHPRDYRAHTIHVRPDSQLAAILGTTEHAVNSLHHQAVRELGRGVRIVAQAPDGIAEGMEFPEHPFAVAVQYHPEELEQADELSRRLFAAFVRACQERAG